MLSRAATPTLGSTTLRVVDISSPASPTVTGSLTALAAGYNYLNVQGRYVYALSNNGTLVTVDVSNPASPTLVGSVSSIIPSGTNTDGPFAVQGRYAYIADGSANNRLDVVDLGGGYVQQMESGGEQTGTLNVRNSLQSMDASIWGALTVGNSLSVTGIANIVAPTSYYNSTNSIFSVSSSSTIPAFTVLGNNNVGIGTSTPGSLFSLNNIANFTAATSTFDSTGGINLASGCFSINGTCVGGSGGGSGTVSTGAQGQFAFYNGSGTTVTATSSIYLAQNGNIGIGTTTPWGMLSINPNGIAGPAFTIGSSTATSLTVTNGGKVGIGTATPFTQLSVMQNASTISQIGSITTGLSGPVGTAVQGRYAYVTNNTGNTLSIFDISNPASPVSISSISTGLNTPGTVVVQGRYAYVANGGSMAVSIYDISNPTSPTYVTQFIATGSSFNALTVEGRYVYAVTNSVIQVIDVSNPYAPISAGSYTLANGRGIAVQGRYAYVPVSVNGLIILDVSNPAAITSVVDVSQSFTGGANVVVQGRYAYVNMGSLNRLYIFDVSTPASASVVSSVAVGTGFTISGLSVQGRYAYVTSNSGITAIDVSNPASPVIVGSNATGLSTPYSLTVLGRFAYVASNGNNALVTFDLGGAYIQQMETGAEETSNLNVRNSLIAQDAAMWGSLTVGNGLNVNGSVSFVAAPSTSGTTNNIFNVSSTSSVPSFTVLGNGSVGIGISTPQSLFAIGNTGGINFTLSTTTFSTTGGINLTSGCFAINGACLAQSWAATGNNIYNPNPGNVGIGTSTPWGQLSVNPNGLSGPAFAIGSSTQTSFIVDNGGRVGIGTATPFAQFSVMQNATTMRLLSSVSTSVGSPDADAVQGRYAYVIHGSPNNTLSIYDISNPASPVAITSTTAGLNFPNGLAVQGRYAYVANYTGSNMTIYDISNPASPALISSTSAGGQAYRIYVEGRYAYVTTSGGVLQIFDVSNAYAPVLLGSATLASGAADVFVQGRYAYVTNNTTGSFYVVNVSNPTSPSLVTTLGVSGTDYGMFIQGHYAYVTDSTNNKLNIINIANPASPVEVGSITTGLNGPMNVSVQGRYAYVTNYGNGAVVSFDVSTPSSPVYVGSVAGLTTGSTTYLGIVVQGRYAYVTNSNGATLNIYDLGGGYVQQLESGSEETGSLSVRNNLTAQDATMWGALTVGQSLQVDGSASFVAASTTVGSSANIFSIAVASSSNPLFAVSGNGNIGIGTSTPSYMLTVGSNTIGANAVVAQFENNSGSCYVNPVTGGFSCSSDARLKNIIGALDATTTFTNFLKLNPTTFSWIADASSTPHNGFIAQQVLPLFPDLVMQGADGYYALNYANFSVYLVDVVQQIANISGAFRDNMIAWLGSASNGIHQIFADVGNFQTINANQICVKKSDGTNVCVTGDQLAAALSTATGATSTNSTSSATSTLPSLTINGNNPAHWALNQPWSDNLGGTFTHNGITETIYSTSTVDTTVAGTTTIDYWATYYPDPKNVSSMQTLHATRDVVVDSPVTNISVPVTTDASSTAQTPTTDPATSTTPTSTSDATSSPQ